MWKHCSWGQGISSEIFAQSINRWAKKAEILAKATETVPQQ
jgi:hypothetical protein